ncbi:sulfurtransferase [Thiomicrospira sp. WB1]|uniref:sulfurtransferase n=1 Tax=Thiomicrospira sp. WB1 TaxID=1685380 RepID=UPI000749AEC5|nr:rhodanese-like domain-containing protein [Thiomicrospira sp. WB1]KUJ71458.1 sulfurtransferase [Thiomicrospira sp. WB1]
MKTCFKGFFTLVLIAFSLQAHAQGRDFLVNSDWLAQNMDDVKVLEVRYHPHRYLTVGHIPGAIQVKRFLDLGDNQSNPLMRLPPKAQFQKTLRQWGIEYDDTIVIYDDSATALASRVYFLLDYYGFDMNNVKLLDGGIREWSVFEETTQTATQTTPSQIVLNDPDPRLSVEWTAIYNDVVSQRQDNVTLLDARPTDMYTGEVIKHSIMGGHIPGAVNVVSLNGITGQNWKSSDELAAMYADIPKNDTVYVYCHDGFRMSLAYMQLKSLGYDDVRLYNGGWSHWGNSLTLPVIDGKTPYSGDFNL